jgi:hypothetical protein
MKHKNESWTSVLLCAVETAFKMTTAAHAEGTPAWRHSPVDQHRPTTLLRLLWNGLLTRTPVEAFK